MLTHLHRDPFPLLAEATARCLRGFPGFFFSSGLEEARVCLTVQDGFLHFLRFVASEFEEAIAHFLGGLPRVFFSPVLQFEEATAHFLGGLRVLPIVAGFEYLNLFWQMRPNIL